MNRFLAWLDRRNARRLTPETAMALEFEQRTFERQVREQAILRGRYHPQHHQMFDEALMFRGLVHAGRMGQLREGT